jgi:hypothetical protein
MTTTLAASNCGFYAGTGIGVVTDVVSLEQGAPSLLAEQRNIAFVNSQRGDVCDTRLWGELYVGYNFSFFRCLHAGLRLGANFTTGELTSRAAWDPGAERMTLTATIRQNHVEPTLDVRGGFIPCHDLLLFVLGGAAYNRIELTQVRLIPQLQLTRSFSTASDLIGWRVGLGLEKLFCCRYGLSFSYIHAYYPTRHQAQTLAVELDPEQPTRVEALRARLSRRIATLGFSYYF